MFDKKSLFQFKGRNINGTNMELSLSIRHKVRGIKRNAWSKVEEQLDFIRNGIYKCRYKSSDGISLLKVDQRSTSKQGV